MTRELSKKLTRGGIVGFMCEFRSREGAKMYAPTVMFDVGSKFISFFANALKSAFVFGACSIHQVLLLSGRSKIALPVIERIVVLMVYQFQSVPRDSEDLPLHSVSMPLPVYCHVANCVKLASGFWSMRVPSVHSYTFVVALIDRCKLALRKGNKPVRIFLGCHGRSSQAARIRPGQQPLASLLYQGGA